MSAEKEVEALFTFEYTGNLHVHTMHSDGGRHVPEIAGSAEKAGLDFIIINDHDFMINTLHIDEEGFYGKVLVLVGSEIGERFHHYLAFDIKEMISSRDRSSPQETIDAVNEQGGFGVLAHPFEKGMPFVTKSIAYTWNDLSVTGYTGICIWNFASRWKERIKTFLHGIYCMVFKHQSLKGPSPKTMAFWDEQCRKGRTVAIGGSDAHGTHFKWGLFNFRPLSYEDFFRSINIHIFLNKWLPLEFEKAKEAVYGAIREGRLFIAHDGLSPSKGFRFDFTAEDGSDLVMGEEAQFREGNLVVEIPSEGEIRLLKDGTPVFVGKGREAVHRVEEKGVYRVEVYKKVFPFGWRPWIFSNPIYLR